jgi:predicted DNA binding CopG/RHH family protein
MKKFDIAKVTEEILNDEYQESWEDGSLGNSDKHVAVSTKTTIRMPHGMIASLKAIAGDQGMPYQTYIKHVLHLHIQERLEKKT